VSWARRDFRPTRPLLSEHQTQSWNPGLSPVAPSVQMPYHPQRPVKFLEPEAYQPLARELFHHLSTMIRQALPGSRIEHIGSSAIEGAVSKGDLDIFVGVEPGDFPESIASIESLGFRIKTESFRNESLCPFESGIYPIPVGLQLVVNRSEFEFFLLFRDRLNADANLRSAYNELKQQASDLDEDGYRHAKSEFIESVLRNANRRPALFKTAHFTAELLSPADLDLVIQLNSECSDFYFLQNGQSPNEADARELFEQVPAQCDPSIKLPIGLFDPQKTLIGVLDVLRGYRTTSDWYIGLMLLSPRFRGQGLGAEVHSEFVAHARQAGVKRLILAVLEANDAGRRFWLRCGYRKIKDYPPRQSGRRFHSLSEFELVIVD
jgi:GrpB-like predicted nucleotidyltransferase (UPF0157 family)/RimJ/RimL family protein N-acetyltransferase